MPCSIGKTARARAGRAEKRDTEALKLEFDLEAGNPDRREEAGTPYLAVRFNFGERTRTRDPAGPSFGTPEDILAPQMKALSLALVVGLLVFVIPDSLTRDDREIWDERNPPVTGSYRYMVIREECLGAWREGSTYIDCVDANVREAMDRAYYKVTGARR